MLQGVRILFLIFSLIIGGIMFQDLITIGFPLGTVFAFIFFIICSLIAVLITTKSKIKYIPKRLGGLFVWACSMTVLISVLAGIYKLHNISPVLISTKFYYEEGLDVEFRKNGTYKALNEDILTGELSYGSYTLKDSLLILNDKLKFGMEFLNDTLRVSNKGISFTMEKPWRINKGQMSFEHLPKAEITLVNNTNHEIDSISITMPYTDQKNNVLSLNPKQTTKYKFKMTKSYNNGEYILLYRIKAQSNKLMEISNILDGYPLQTVNAIHFEEHQIKINLIFGNEITLAYL